MMNKLDGRVGTPAGRPASNRFSFQSLLMRRVKIKLLLLPDAKGKPSGDGALFTQPSWRFTNVWHSVGQHEPPSKYKEEEEVEREGGKKVVVVAHCLQPIFSRAGQSSSSFLYLRRKK